MSLWRRLASVFGADAPAEASGQSVGLRPQTPNDIECLRASMLASLHAPSPVDVEAVAAAFEQLCSLGAEAEALVTLEASLPNHRDAIRLVTLAARHQADRGNDARAAELLMASADQLGASELLRLADSLDRVGRRDEAIAAVEKALGREVNVFGGRERLARLTDKRNVRPRSDATLMGGVDPRSSRYRVVGALGRGGAGVVLHAEDSVLSRRVALKTYHSRGPAALGRLFVEARTAAQFADPSVVRVLDVDPECCALVMELHPLGSFADAVEKRRLSPDEARRRLRELSQALSLVHRSGVVHRDVKMSNVLLREDGIVLSDFGLARTRGTRLAPGEVLDGTPGVVPPGLVAGTSVGLWFDVFAFGRVIEEVVAAYPEMNERLSVLATRCHGASEKDCPSLDELEAALR